MSHYRYLIAGGGMAADAAVRGIRSLDEEGSIGIVSEEPDPPYDRPPLSKGLWKGGEEDAIRRGTGELDVDIHLERRIERIDPDDRTVTDERGAVHSYDRLLLATGGRPRKLSDASPQVVYFRTREDYRRLRELAHEGDAFTVIGGGFIGSEIAAALALHEKDVTLVFPEEGIGGNVFPADLAHHLNETYAARGVDVRPETKVASVRRSRRFLLVATEGGDGEETPAEGPGSADTIRADGVVAGLGIEPNQELAATAGLEVAEEEDGGGIVVDERMRTSAEDVYAAGDVASVWSVPLGRRLRFEHEDQANSTGMHAGRAMAGAEERYDHLPFFYSDLFDLSYEAVGLLDPSLRVIADWEKEFREGVLYYLDDGRIRGVLLWGVRGKLKKARALIRSEERFTPESVRGTIT